MAIPAILAPPQNPPTTAPTGGLTLAVDQPRLIRLEAADCWSRLRVWPRGPGEETQFVLGSDCAAGQLCAQLPGHGPSFFQRGFRRCQSPASSGCNGATRPRVNSSICSPSSTKLSSATKGGATPAIPSFAMGKLINSRLSPAAFSPPASSAWSPAAWCSTRPASCKRSTCSPAGASP